MSQSTLISKAHLATFLQEFLTSPKESNSRTIDVEIQGVARYYLVAMQKYQQGTAVVSVGIDITERKQAKEVATLTTSSHVQEIKQELSGSPDMNMLATDKNSRKPLWKRNSAN